MKVPATLLMLLAAQAAPAADFAARVTAGRATPPSKEATEYYTGVMTNIVLPVMRICAPPGANTATQDWMLTVVGTISAIGRIEDVDAEPVNAITTCVVERLGKVAPLAPPAGIMSDVGFPLLVELKMTNVSNSTPRNPVTATPVFSQLVAFVLPGGFAQAFESAAETRYINESVPKGESIEQWSQMITLSGAKDQARDPRFTPAQYAEKIATQFQRACPATFAIAGLGTVKISGQDAFVAMMGCGTVESGPPRSEIAVVIAIRGKSDMYTIQWAERSAPSTLKPSLDAEKWRTRFQQMNPLRICDRVADEAAPFPSCINQAGQ